MHHAGGVVSPANPAYTVRELVHHLQDSGARALVTQKGLLKVALEACREIGIPRTRIICIGEDDQQPGSSDGVVWFKDLLAEGNSLVKSKGLRERVVVDPEKDLAFLVYSSGTTGLPKGVMLSHMNVVSDLHMVNWSEGSILHWKRDKILSILPYYHIYGAFYNPRQAENTPCILILTLCEQAFNASSISQHIPAQPLS